MHELEFKLTNPVVEGTFDHGRTTYHVIFDGTLLKGEIRTAAGLEKFLVTIHPPSRDAVQHAAGISVEDIGSKEAAIDVTLDEAIIHKLMNLVSHDVVSLLVRFANGGTKGPHGVEVFEATPNRGIDWYANRALNVPHVFCSINIEKAGTPEITAASLHVLG